MFSKSKKQIPALLAATALAALVAPMPARADGCTVLLCLAGNWRNISQCVPPVRRALRDVARGRAWPSCSMSNSSNSSSSSSSTSAQMWSTMLGCPEQYTTTYQIEGSVITECAFSHFVNVQVEGQLWSRLYFSIGNDSSVTEYTPRARARLPAEQIDPQFDNDLAAYQARKAEEAIYFDIGSLGSFN